MTPWVLATVALAVLIGGSILPVARGGPLARAVGLQLTTVLGTLFVLVVAIATGRRIVLDVALVLAVLGLAGGLAYARFLERWL